MILSIRQFLVNAQLGDVKMGDSKQAVYTLMDEPEGVGQKDAIWKYGSIQIGFYQRKVSFLGIYFREAVVIPPRLVVVGFFPHHNTTISEFEDFLKRENVSYKVFKELTFDNQLCFTTEKGVQILFDIHRNKIDSIQS